MKTNCKKRSVYSVKLKYLVIIPLFISFLCVSTHAFSQIQPPPPPAGGPPPPPPGELLKKINPFKKHKKDTTANKNSTAKSNTPQTNGATPQPTQPAGPPPPPNPLDLFKKKKKDTTKTSKS
jgi:hypothetical protein